MRSYSFSTAGLGIDVVAISRIQRLLSEHPTKFRDFAFSSSEQQYCDKQNRPESHYAGRWAVKEAFIKAIGKQNVNPDLSCIETTRDPTPCLSLLGDSARLIEDAATEAGSAAAETTVTVSLAHEPKLDAALGAVMIWFQ